MVLESGFQVSSWRFSVSHLGFGVFRVCGLDLVVGGLKLWVSGSGFRVGGSAFRIGCSRFSGFRVCGSGFSRFGVSGEGFRGSGFFAVLRFRFGVRGFGLGMVVRVFRGSGFGVGVSWLEVSG